MALVTNRCKKHQTAHPEEECPRCVREEAEKQREASKEFFENYGQCKIELIPGRIVRVEELYQHFRARLLDELTPVLREGQRE